MKKSLRIFFITLLLLVALAAQAQAAEPVKVIIEGEAIALDANPVIVNGRVMVPVRQIVESLGGDVTWNASSQTVHIVKDDKNILLVINSNVAKVNDTNKTLDVSARIIGGRTMIPLRFVSENLDANVTWNPKSYTVTIDVPVNFNNEAYDLLVKATQKSLEVKQSKADLNADFSLNGTTYDSPVNITAGSKGTIKADILKPAFSFDGNVFLKDEGFDLALDTKFLFLNGKIYLYDSTTEKWMVETLPADEFNEIKELLNQTEVSAQLNETFMTELKNSGVVRNLDFVGQKTINGINTKGVNLEISGPKLKNLIQKAILESDNEELADVITTEELEEVFSGLEFTKFELTYWIGEDNNIYGSDLDFRCIFKSEEDQVDVVFAFHMESTISEINKPQVFVAPKADEIEDYSTEYEDDI